ncbi:MAG: VanZ family protein [Pirellulaceae bacterium]
MPPGRSIRLAVAGVLLAGYWLALFVATHIPLRDALPGAGFDKVLHAAAYAGLAFLLATVVGLLGRLSWRGYLVILALVALYGAIDEAMQTAVPGRSADAMDWAADVIGGLIGLLAHAVCFSLLHRFSRS